MRTQPDDLLPLQGLADEQIVSGFRKTIADAQSRAWQGDEWKRVAATVVFSVAHAWDRPNLAQEVLAVVYGQDKDDALQATLSTAIFTALVQSDYDPAVAKVALHAMELQQYNDGALVLLLGEVAQESTSVSVTVGYRDLWTATTNGKGEVTGVRYSQTPDIGDEKGRRLMFVPHAEARGLPTSITLPQSEIAYSIGHRTVLLGNFLTADSAKRRFASMNQVEMKLYGFDKAMVVLFNPQEQDFSEVRCREWNSKDDYIRFVTN